MKTNLTNILFFLSIITLVACHKSNNTAPSNPTSPTTVATDTLYFPPVTGTAWSTTSAASLGWNTTNLTALNTYLQSVGTKAFIILKGGKIVTEQYFGTFTADSLWYWDSAGKTVTGLLVGIAQTQGLVNINNKVSTYIGTGWTSETLAEENAITVKNLLTMTSGLNDGVPDNDSTLPVNLVYLAPAGTRWAYHTGAYTILDSVIERSSGETFNTYFQQNLGNKIGMSGFWYKIPGANNVLYSNARSMARFGLLMLNKGKWDNQVILSDTSYFRAQVNTSQAFNLSYGYLTWLNGKASQMLPGYQTVYPGDVIPNGPTDMFMALGKNDQKVYVVPSQQLVIIRMGNTAGGESLAVSDFDNTLWGKLNAIIQ
jgi:CubicO group peptidase (beta-lactamase class C family)